MEIHINDKMTILDLQQQFSNVFPFLKLEIFEITHTSNGLSKSRVHPNYKQLGACRKNHIEGTLNFSSNDPVEKLEKNLWQQFGLSAEVFRKSGYLWIETSLSDTWTLQSQNEEGRIFSALQPNKKAV